MGGGSWTSESFTSYSTSKGRGVDSRGVALTKSMRADQLYEQRKIHKRLDPLNVMRECCDSDEHPETIPVILALDVTGSMGQTAVEVSSELNTIMTELYKDTKDVEFMIMGIGDFSCDNSPLQVSQFESDIRIAEQLDLLYFEFGGGGNDWESYTAPWAFGITQTKLDCWKRNKKGIIITMGDEVLNPYIPLDVYKRVTGHGADDFGEEDYITTEKLYKSASKLFDIYHIDVNHSRFRDVEKNCKSFAKVLGEDHVFSTPVNGIAQIIAQIVKNSDRDAGFATGGLVTPEPVDLSTIEDSFMSPISW